MARGFIRKPSFWKIVGAYRSQWKRAIKRFFFPCYGRKGMGWWHNPRKAAYNWWYHRTSVSAYDFGLFPRKRPSRAFVGLVMGAGLICSLLTLPADLAEAVSVAFKVKRLRKRRATGFKRTSSKAHTAHTGDCSSGTAAKAGAKSNPAASAESGRSSVPSPALRKEHAPKPERNASASTGNPSKPEARAPKPAMPPSPRTPAKKPERTAFTSYRPIEFVAVETFAPQIEPDENTPKSKPKSENDRYIRKRMIIAGSSYCDGAVLARLRVGTYIDLVAEPENPYDKNAIRLTCQGEKVGYVGRTDQSVFLTHLRLGRRIYGVITEIIEEADLIRYEYETWFSSDD